MKNWIVTIEMKATEQAVLHWYAIYYMYALDFNLWFFFSYWIKYYNATACYGLILFLVWVPLLLCIVKCMINKLETGY